jgi:hypothetical protein
MLRQARAHARANNAQGRGGKDGDKERTEGGDRLQRRVLHKQGTRDKVGCVFCLSDVRFIITTRVSRTKSHERLHFNTCVSTDFCSSSLPQAYFVARARYDVAAWNQRGGDREGKNVVFGKKKKKASSTAKSAVRNRKGALMEPEGCYVSSAYVASTHV